MRFTDRYVATLKKPEERKVIWEDGEHGKGALGLRLSPSGGKSWVYMYVDPRTKKPRMATLGRYPEMTVAKAHEVHSRAVQAVERGEDPAAPLVAAKAAQRTAPTVEALATEYLEKWAEPNKKSWREDQRMIEHDILPAWGGIRGRDVTRREVIRLIDGIVSRGSPIAAAEDETARNQQRILRAEGELKRIAGSPIREQARKYLPFIDALLTQYEQRKAEEAELATDESTPPKGKKNDLKR